MPQHASAGTKVSYVLAVFLLAPIAVIVPLTISTAVGSSSIVGERERGTGEFLAHSPAGVHEIYLGKLIASLIPGYLTTLVGFGLYSLMVNLIVGPDAGGWFFPTPSWWLLILWVLPPFLLIALSLVLRLSARVKSTAAAQQAAGLITFPLILIAYGQSTGALFGGSAVLISVVLGAVAWAIGIAPAGQRHALADPGPPAGRGQRGLTVVIPGSRSRPGRRRSRRSGRKVSPAVARWA